MVSVQLLVTSYLAMLTENENIIPNPDPDPDQPKKRLYLIPYPVTSTVYYTAVTQNKYDQEACSSSANRAKPL